MPTTSSDIKRYSVGDLVSSGERVQDVVADAEHFSIFRTNEGAYYQQTDFLRERSHDVCTEYTRLMTRSKIVSTSSALEKQLATDILTAFALALDRCVDGVGNPTAVFGDVKRRIDGMAENRVAGLITITALLAFVLFVLLIVFVCSVSELLRGGLWLMSIGCLAGAIGAIFSVLFVKNRSRIGGYYSTDLHIILQVISRLTIGFIAGGVCVVLIRGGIVLTFAKDNLYLCVLGALASGFVENKIPSILTNYASQEDRTVIDRIGGREV